MQKILLLVVLVMSYGIVSAQCDKKYKFKTEKVVKINGDGSEGEEEPISAEITLSKDSIVIAVTGPDGSPVEIVGKLKEGACKMNADYSEGTYDFKVDAEMNRNGESRQMKLTFNMEAKAGKVKFFGVPDDQQGEKICFVIKEKVAG